MTVYVELELTAYLLSVPAKSSNEKPERKGKQVEKEELYELLKAYGGYESTTYTKDSWEVFKEAYDKAKEVYRNKNTTQEEVDKVIEELKVSGKQLVKAEVRKS
mgnify:CR=1 FL=1